MKIVKAGMGAFGDIISDTLASPDPDTQAGVKMFEAYWHALKVYNPEIPKDFAAFMAGLKDALVPVSESAKWPGYIGPVYPNNPDGVFAAKINGIGMMLNKSGVPGFSWSSLVGSDQAELVPVPSGQIENAMSELASKGQGHIMADINQYFNAIMGQVTNPPFIDVLWYVAQAAAAQTAQAAQQVGNAVLDTAGSLLKYKNFVLFGALGFAGLILYMRYVPRKR